jgi:hypothetical protein
LQSGVTCKASAKSLIYSHKETENKKPAASGAGKEVQSFHIPLFAPL